MLSLHEIQAAARVLDGVAVRTPVLHADAIDGIVGAHVLFKAENLQRMGAFKFRGAYHAIARLDGATRARGVACFTSGNHGLSVARAAQLLGAPATVVMPADAPAMKIEGVRACGATTVLYDRYRDDRQAIARDIVAAQGLTLIAPFDDEAVIAGQGTAALELLQDTAGGGRLDAMIVCVGGGGFLSGCTVAAKGLQPSIRMVGAEPVAGNDAEQSMRAGRIVALPAVPRTICDGQQTLSLGERPFAIFRAHDVEVLSVDDATVVQAMRLAFEHLKVVIEPSGACALAVLLRHRERFAGQRVGVTLSGGNVDFARFTALLSGG